jgi:DNA repair protein SbcD/Mre11
MPRFLHLADIHLGFDKYESPERTQDFFYALQDVLERYALNPPVDFVLIAGDLFEHRNILPATLNQAQICLEMLQQAEIPVLAIEGNHDNRPYGTPTSWLRYLADQGWLILLEPNPDSEFEPWNPATRVGGYLDLPCGVRVLGSLWYGASSPQSILKLAENIRQLPSHPLMVMMFHHGLEGQISRYAGALQYRELLPLKQAGVKYLALGHIHKNYTAEGWIFNPGSLEANSVNENEFERGVYLVTLERDRLQAELKQDYRQRRILRLSLKATPQQTATELEQAAIALIQHAANQRQTQGAIVELKITGQVSFERQDLAVRPLRTQLQQLSQALILLLPYDVTSTTYLSELTPATDHPPSRLEIEQHVFTDFLAAKIQYRDHVQPLVKGLIELKTQILAGESESEMFDFLETLINPQ